jgi:hypothetical protein
MKAKGFCLALAAGVMAVAACSSASSTPAGYGGYGDGNPVGQPSMAPAASAAGEVGYPYPTAAPSVASAAQSGSKPASNGGVNPAPTVFIAQPEDQIIKTGSISIQVAELDTAIARATDEMHGLGGWLAGSDRTVTSAEDLASVTYRVPVAQFENALALMRRLGVKVLSEHTGSTPVGGQIIDLQARIANLKASETAIQAIMAKANTIGDVLTVQERLTEIRGQIEELSGQLAGLTDQSAYSTLTVVFEVPILATPTPSPSPSPTPMPTATVVPWSAGDQAGQAAAALGEVGQGTATVLIWLVILIVPIGLAGLLLLLLTEGGARVGPRLMRRLFPSTLGRSQGSGMAPAQQPAAAQQPTAPNQGTEPKP